MNNLDLSDRTRLTSRIIAKDLADKAAAEMLDRFGLADCVKNRVTVERELAAVLSERIERGVHDPAARVGVW